MPSASDHQSFSGVDENEKINMHVNSVSATGVFHLHVLSPQLLYCHPSASVHLLAFSMKGISSPRLLETWSPCCTQAKSISRMHLSMTMSFLFSISFKDGYDSSKHRPKPIQLTFLYSKHLINICEQ